MRNKYNATQIRQMVEEDGLSLSEVARRLDTKACIISNFCKRNNIKSQHMHEAAEKPFPNTIYLDYIAGSSLYMLSKFHQIPIDRIKRQLRKRYPDLKIRTIDEVMRPAALNSKSVLAELMATHSLTRIGRILGVKTSTVCAAVRRLSLTHLIRKTIVPISDDLIIELHEIKKFSISKIAAMCGCSYGAIKRRLLRHGSEPWVAGGQKRNSKHAQLNDPIWLKARYCDDKMTMSDLAKMIGTTVGNISYHLRKHGIETRSKSEYYRMLLMDRHGSKQSFNGIDCDSTLEVDFLRTLANTDTVIRNIEMSAHSSWCTIDFKVGDDYIEVKPKGQQSVVPGVNRRRLIKQMLIAKENGIALKVWNGDYCDITIGDDDIYYAVNWKLFFPDANACASWLIGHGFNGVRWSDGELIDGLKDALVVKIGNELNANYPNTNVLKAIKHFSQHYWYSSHKDYLPVSAAWQQGNHNILKAALAGIWSKSKEVNIYGLVKAIQHDFKDFALPSIFKPWVASYIYDKYLPDGGRVIDSCMGWGGRLIGCFDKAITYIGSDLNKHAVDSHIELRKFAGSRLKIEPSFSVLDARFCTLPPGDLLFTSPPYDDCEIYHGVDVCNSSFTAIMSNLTKFDGRMMILNVPLRLESVTTNMAQAAGFSLVERLEMKTSSFMGRKKTHEPILVFRR